ncbi:hypothetical protein [Sphingobacterium multivorum]|uniref:hypothetical protein n=1 Tax=Sphingobacterium multivorum TaxID=28454 RepID=UPI0021145D76|nr:hypothetical protein [Sphingobacterium multivorum]
MRLSGAEAITYNLTQEQNWLIDLNELKKQDLSKVKLMWINYPICQQVPPHPMHFIKS